MNEFTTNEQRIFGPPGTGKSTALLAEARTAVAQLGNERVLVTSFSRTAARELVNRGLDIPPSQAGTLHAFCHRILGRPDLAESNLADWNKLNRRFALSAKTASLYEPALESLSKTVGDVLMAQYQFLRARMTQRDEWPSRVREFAANWERWKSSGDLLDFTDLIELVLAGGAPAPGAPAVILADEVQDFSPLEIALLRMWGGHAERLVLAGDDDQTIFAFKGATPQLFLSPPIPAAQKRVLNESRRIPYQVQQVANRWVTKLSLREPKVFSPRRVDGDIAQGEVARSGATCRYPELAVLDALRQLERGRSVMFLTSCAHMLKALQAVLRRNGIAHGNPYRSLPEWTFTGRTSTADTNTARGTTTKDSTPGAGGTPAGDASLPKVIIGTIHSVKGGEADAVYLFPDISRSAMLEWTRPGEGRDALRRTFYVGMTRARERLVLCSAASPCAVSWTA